MTETCHVLESSGTVYSAVLTMSDTSTGLNSYYKLQVLERDVGNGWYRHGRAPGAARLAPGAARGVMAHPQTRSLTMLSAVPPI